jgi:hypothetical protein
VGHKTVDVDVDAHAMLGIGASCFAGGAHDLLDGVAVEESKGTRVVAAERAEWVIEGNAEGVGSSQNGKGSGNGAQERVVSTFVLADTVVRGALVVSKANVEICGGSGVISNGKVGQTAAVGIEAMEILANECEGLACAGALGNSREWRFLVGLALSAFGEARTGVWTKTCPIVDCCCASKEGLAVMVPSSSGVVRRCFFSHSRRRSAPCSAPS